MESLFGAETPLTVRFFIAFIVVFALIGVTAWLVRRFGTGRLGAQGARGRAPRLAVIEAGAVDGRRKLVLIRRDNTEHLLMIGGPTDIVVEQNIVRASSPAREAASARGTGTNESLPRAVPLGEATSWPLAPEPAPAAPTRPARTPRAPAAEESLNWSPQAEPAPTSKRQRPSDTLAGLAAELSTRPSTQPEVETPKARVTPKLDSLRATPAAIPAPAAAASPAVTPDQNLADMAQRLEAALRRPGKPGEAPAVTPAPQRAAPPVNGAREKAAETPQPAPEQPAKKPDNVFGSLEDEMASLLGRPPGKT